MVYLISTIILFNDSQCIMHAYDNPIVETLRDLYGTEEIALGLGI